jgi:RNA polymerase sigma-54 factor
MTPQLQQAIKLLQYNHLEMINALEHELKENPVLEIETDEEALTGQEARKAVEDAPTDLVGETRNLQDLALDIDWQNYMETYGADYARPNAENDGRSAVDNFSRNNSDLFHHLLEQLQLSRFSETDRRIAIEIIGNVNEDGYLELDLEEFAKALEVPLGDVERVLGMVQEFDPPGVAARDLKECLAIQARLLDSFDELVLRIMEDAFDLFLSGKMDKVARKFKVDLSDIEAASKVIAAFDPKPGRRFNSDESRYVVPDIYVYKMGNDYSVEVNDDGLPRLRISPFYHQHLHRGAAETTVGAKDYIKEKIRGATTLMKSIHQRQRTIYKVAVSIVKFQREFLDKGIDHLKPLILKDVAQDVEMHESTISRVTANKYMHTPQGIFELKYFFNSAIRQGAEEIASESVKNHILRIVKSEDPKNPVSDKQIVDDLDRSGIQIARRTVAKYREMMGISPSSKRKKIF